MGELLSGFYGPAVYIVKPLWYRIWLKYIIGPLVCQLHSVDKPEAPVDPTGLAPVTSDTKAGYLLYNTTGPFPGLCRLYHNDKEANNFKRVNSSSVVAVL